MISLPFKLLLLPFRLILFILKLPFKIILLPWKGRRSSRKRELAEPIPVSHPQKPDSKRSAEKYDQTFATAYPTNKSADVFISYAEEDGDVAYALALGLEGAGYTTWCYELDNVAGVSYLIQTGQMIEDARAFLVLISPHSISSRQITQEIIRAHETNKHFFPILRDITHVDFQRRQPEWREAIGAATSITFKPGEATGIITRIVPGLKALGVHPRNMPDTERCARIRQALCTKL